MTEKDLTIKVEWEIENQVRIDKLYLHVKNNGELVVNIQNGRDRETGKRSYGRIRLNSDQQKLVREFLNNASQD